MPCHCCCGKGGNSSDVDSESDEEASSVDLVALYHTRMLLEEAMLQEQACASAETDSEDVTSQVTNNGKYPSPPIQTELNEGDGSISVMYPLNLFEDDFVINLFHSLPSDLTKDLCCGFCFKIFSMYGDVLTHKMDFYPDFCKAVGSVMFDHMLSTLNDDEERHLVFTPCLRNIILFCSQERECGPRRECAPDNQGKNNLSQTDILVEMLPQVISSALLETIRRKSPPHFLFQAPIFGRQLAEGIPKLVFNSSGLRTFQWNIVRCDKTRYLRGQTLYKMRHMERYQDLSAAAFESCNEARVPIAVSHTWLSTTHPDPNGKHLEQIHRAIDRHIALSYIATCSQCPGFLQRMVQGVVSLEFLQECLDGWFYLLHPRLYKEYLYCSQTAMTQICLNMPLLRVPVTDIADRLGIWYDREKHLGHVEFIASLELKDDVALERFGQAIIDACPSVLDVLCFWIDYCCLPQKPRSPEHQIEFKIGLSRINDIFSHSLVLALGTDQVDKYFHRGWCASEAYWSRNEASQFDRMIVAVPACAATDHNFATKYLYDHRVALDKNFRDLTAEMSLLYLFEEFHERRIVVGAQMLVNLGLSCTNGDDLKILSKQLLSHMLAQDKKIEDYEIAWNSFSILELTTGSNQMKEFGQCIKAELGRQMQDNDLDNIVVYIKLRTPVLVAAFAGLLNSWKNMLVIAEAAECRPLIHHLETFLPKLAKTIRNEQWDQSMLSYARLRIQDLVATLSLEELAFLKGQRVIIRPPPTSHESQTASKVLQFAVNDDGALFSLA